MENEKSRLQIVLALLILSVVLSGCFWLGIFMNMNAAGQRGYSAWIIVIFISLASPIPLGFAKSMWDLDNNSPGNGEFNSGWLAACLVGHVIGLYSLYLIVAKYPRCLREVLEKDAKSREFRRLELELKKIDADLEGVNGNITYLEKQKNGLTKQAQVLIDQSAKAQVEIGRLTAGDPANLGLKAKELKRLAKELSNGELRDALTRVNRDLQEVSHAKQRARKELVTLESNASKQENRLRELDRLVMDLEMRDPSNIRLQVKVLSNEWRNLSESELEAVPVRNEISKILKELNILKRRIERTRAEIDAVRRRVNDTNVETVLMLEKCVDDMELISRTPQPEKEQISKIEADLQSLYAERNTLEQRKLQIMK